MTQRTVWLFFFLVLSSWYIVGSTNKEASANSSEYNFFNASPVGESGGLAIPASCPSNLHDDPNFGQACTSLACGVPGTRLCGGACSASDPVWYGQACSSVANNCGQTGTGVRGCAPGSCSAVRPADVALGASCNSLTNNCGDFNTGTIGCGGCSATKPADRVCGPPPILCGNSSPNPGEACDLGAGNGSCPSTCSAICQVNNCGTTTCGDGITQAPETCDLGAGNGAACPSTCSTTCQSRSCPSGPRCGDSVCDSGEDACNCASDCTSGTCGFPSVQAQTYKSPWWNPVLNGQSPATAIPSGSSAWLYSRCVSGTTGRHWAFANPSGSPAPPTALQLQFGPNFPTGGANGAETFVGHEVWEYDSLWNGTRFNPWVAPQPAGGRGYGVHPPGGHVTYDFSTNALVANTVYRTICWDREARMWDYADATVFVQGSNTQPTSVINGPVAGSTFTQGTNINFSGTGTDTDGTIIAYEWRKNGCGAAGVVFGSSSNGAVAPPATPANVTNTDSTFPLGTHTVYLRVRDNSGIPANEWSACASRTFNVVPAGNIPPTATITNPAITPTIIAGGTNVNFTGFGTDPETGSVIEYEWRDGTLAQCQSKIGGTVLSTGATVGNNTPLFSKSDLTVGIHDIFLSVKDPSGAPNAWSTNCPVRRIIVNMTTPGPPTTIRSCRMDLATGRYYADLSFTEPNAVRYHVGVDYIANNTLPIVVMADWNKSTPPDLWLPGFPATSYSFEVTPNQDYGWWASGENASGVIGPSSGEFFRCGTLNFQVCRTSCNSGQEIIEGSSIAMFDNSPPINLVACFNPGLNCSRVTGDVTTPSPPISWIETNVPQNAASLGGISPKVLSPNPMALPGVFQENMRATYGPYTRNWRVDVTKFCSSNCDPVRSANTCLGDSYPAPVDSCGTPETCNGTRQCDFNWKEVAP